MNAPIDTLAFAERFEGAGFGHEQARALAVAFGDAQDTIRDGLATKADLNATKAEIDLSLAALEGRMNKQFGDFESRMTKQFGELEVRITRQIGDSAKDVTGRLWSAVAIIAGVSTAISATIGAGVTLLLRSGALS